MLRVHHLNRSRSFRIVWLLEELGFEYEIIQHRRDRRTSLAPQELIEIHPLGKAPLLEHDGRAVAESGAIVEYLVDLADGRLRPTEHEALLDYRFFLHYAEGSVMPNLVLKLIMDMLSKKSPLPFRPIGGVVSLAVHKAYLQAQLDLHSGFIERSLSDRSWFTGMFSAVDVHMHFCVEAMRARGILTERAHPNATAFLERCAARPAFARASERGGALEL